MSNVPGNLRYSKEHEWCLNQNGIATVGITEFAQSELGDIVYVELPETGVSVSADDKVAECESVKAVSDIYTPVSGEIIEVNSEISDSPQIINESPYEKGWIFRIKLSDENEMNSLLTDEQYNSMISN